MAKVSYKQGLKSTYLGLSERLPTALYFCTDTHELFKGNDLYTDGLRVVTSYAELPEFPKAAEGKIYYCADIKCGYVLNETHDGWTQVIFGTDGETLEVNEGGLMQVKAVPVGKVAGLDTYVTGLVEKAVGNLDLNIGVATKEKAGVVKPGDDFDVDADGTLSLNTVTIEKVTGLEDRLNEFRPVAKADLNTQQFELKDGVLNIIGVDSSLVAHQGTPLRDILDEVAKALTWEDMSAE
nr:MAG TPA: hypothetical protein [Caudoviricetes sp.]